jgi:chromosome segregation ATPase
MEFTEIDRQFDEAFERLTRQSPTVTSAYGTSPLAADHFLLKKSWDYFRNRVKNIEEQWRKMLEAKEQQLRTTMLELTESRQRQADLEEDNHLLRSLDRNVKKARAEDYVGFARKSENLRLHWDAEREALQRKIDALERKVIADKKTADLRVATTITREQKLKETLEAMRDEASLFADRERDIQKKCAEELTIKDEKIQSLDSNVDIFRSEVDRRDQLLKQLKDMVTTSEKDAVAMTAYVEELQRALKDKDLDLANLKAKLEILTQEKTNLQAGWERERSEWRELWDRGRSLWDKNKSRREPPSP